MASRRFKGIFTLLLLPLFLFATPLDSDSEYALRALYHGAFAVIASQVKASPVDLGGVTIEERNEEGNAYLISFNRSDISKYSNSLKGENATWYQSILNRTVFAPTPLEKTALAMLADYNSQDVLLDGVVTINFEKGIRAKELFDIIFTGNIDNVKFNLILSMLVTPKNGVPIVFEGELSGFGDRSRRLLIINTDKMTCDGRPIVIEPMEFKM
ncbi:MAG: hypothetical protein K6G51_00035 [Sphaerochaetaceae bacterium]|nr:hypothetical protein [Sphaerochaetaceae bacterium]